MNAWEIYLAIAAAGFSSLGAVWILTVGVRLPRYRRPYIAADDGSDTAAGDSRQRLDDIDRKLTLLVRYVEEQIPRVVAEGMRAQLAAVTLSDTPESGTKTTTEPSDSGPIIREIAHSLNTPLAQIEASALSMSGITGEQRRKVDRILEGVRICKSFLGAFREVSTLTRDSHAWSPDSLTKALHAAAMIYGQRGKRSTVIDVQMPDSVPGYSNSFVMAILLPLLENAVEAVPSDGAISVRGDPVGDIFRLSICNDSTESALSTDIYSEGYTTKRGHDGLGLSAVRRLVASREAYLDHQVEAGKVTFTIDLPRGHNEY